MDYYLNLLTFFLQWQNNLLPYVTLWLYLSLPPVVSSSSNRYDLFIISTEATSSINTGVAMNCNSYLPKQEWQFLQMVMEELDTFYSDSNRMRYLK